MSASPEQLNQLLQAELRTLTALAQTLNAEYRALIDTDVSMLEHATAQKNTAIAAHSAQQNSRLSWMNGLGMTSQSSLGDLVSHCGANPDSASLQEQLATLATQCQEDNRRNGGLIIRLQERTRGALDVLRRDDAGPDLYSLSGSKQHHSDSRTLGKA